MAKSAARRSLCDRLKALREGKANGEDEAHHGKDCRHKGAAHVRSSKLSGDDADRDAWAPIAQECEVGVAGPTVRQKRNDRRGQDRGERCRDCNMHRLVRCHTAAHQPIVNDGNHNDPTANSDQACQQPGPCAGSGAHRNQRQNVQLPPCSWKSTGSSDPGRTSVILITAWASPGAYPRSCWTVLTKPP